MKLSMKKYIIIILVSFVICSCTDSTLKDTGFSVKSLPAYVSYGNSGGTVAEKLLAPSEGSTSTALTVLRIESPGVTTSDIAVSFTFGGTAVFGVDYNVSGLTATENLPFAITATSAGGIITIAKSAKKTTVNDYEFVNLKLAFPKDGVKDGNKKLTITLTSATGTDGKTYAVGRGGTDVLKIATVNIKDID